MSSTETDLLESEVQLGKALALIHRVLPRLSEAGWDSFVQDSLKGAIAQVEAARQSHQNEAASRKPTAASTGPARPQSIPAEILAVAAAAAHALFDKPFRIVSVQETDESALQWSAEGRRLIFSSHRIR
jgi:hypothetical protein